MDLAHTLPIFIVSLLASWGITWGVRRFALQWGVVAKRNARRRHERDTPLLGGTAFYVVTCALAASAYVMRTEGGTGIITLRSALCFFGAITLIYAVGAWDDFHEIKAPPKFVAQVAAAVLILMSRPELPTILQDTFLPSWLAAPVLVLWIVGITNAMNMIDGLDGLSAGIGAITALALTAIIITTGIHQHAFSLYLIVALAGCCVGFLFHNFHPAKIFLGDSGSLFIGFVLAVVSVKLEVKRSLFVSLSIPIMVLGLPILDVGLSIIRRKRLERSIFQGDRSHIHHRLQQVGLSHRGAVIVLWLCAAYLNSAAYFLAKVPPSQSIFIYASVVPTLAFWVVALYFIERRLSFQAARYSHLFLKEEDITLRDRPRLVEYMADQVRASDEQRIPFSVVVVDCQDFIKELAHERAHRVVAFYMNLYGILKARLRRTDLVARVSDQRFICVLAGTGSLDGSDPAIVEFLNDEVKGLQEAYQIFLSNPRVPEGFRVYRYPKDARRIWEALKIEESELRLAPSNVKPIRA